MSRGHVTGDEVSRYRAGAASGEVIPATCRTPGPGQQDQLGSADIGSIVTAGSNIGTISTWSQQQSAETKVSVIFRLASPEYKAIRHGRASKINMDS